MINSKKRKCNLVNNVFSSDNLDIIFYDLNKRWQIYNRKKSENIGICYQGFVEFFLTYSQLNFNEKSLEQSIKSMISHCRLNLKKDFININEDYLDTTDQQSNEQEMNSRFSNFTATTSGLLCKTPLLEKKKSKKSLFPIFF